MFSGLWFLSTIESIFILKFYTFWINESKILIKLYVSFLLLDLLLQILLTIKWKMLGPFSWLCLVIVYILSYQMTLAITSFFFRAMHTILVAGWGRLCLYTNYHFFIPSILLLTSYGDNYVHYIIYDSFRNNRFVWWSKNHTRGTIKSGYLKLWRCGQSTDCVFELVLSTLVAMWHWVYWCLEILCTN